MIRLDVAKPGDPKTEKVLVKPKSFARFAVVMACNALGLKYTRDLGLTRPLFHGKDKWVHPNARFPLRG